VGAPEQDLTRQAHGQPPWPLAEDEVHVWYASLDRGAGDVERLRALLSSDETARAGRFHFDRDRTRYVVGRGILRLLIGAYTGMPAERVTFLYGLYDKPHLAEGGLWFNLSHSGAVALLAFGRRVELGVDVELAEEDFARLRIAEMFFSPGEVRALRSLREDLQPRAFLACWTRKEAFIKARGDGLQLALDSFDVTLDPTSPPALLRTAWSPEEPREWSLHDLSDPERGYIAALALRSRGERIARRSVPDELGDFPAVGASARA
jgi:4'-phosphopantetheinyl transferase